MCNPITRTSFVSRDLYVESYLYVAGISSASSETSTLFHWLIFAKAQEEAIEEHLADIKNTVASMTHDGGAEIQKGRVSAAGASPSQVPSEPIYMNILW